MKKIDFAGNTAIYLTCILTCLSLCCMIFVLGGCSKPTSPKGNLTGQITIEGLTDLSGATIAIYHIAPLDTALVRLNQEYANVGVVINQKTEFDFRAQTPLQTTQSNVDGTFALSGLQKGTYNIVVQKNGFGFRIIYDFNIASGSNNLNTAPGNSQIILYPETNLTGLVSGSITLLTDHHYVCSSDVNFDPAGSVTIQPGAVIRVAPNSSVKFYGQISFQGTLNNMIRFTSNDGISISKNNPGQNRLIQNFNQIRFEEGATISGDFIEGCIFTYGDFGLTSFITCNMRNMIFRTHRTSFNLQGTVPSPIANDIIENCLFQDALDLQSEAAKINNITSITFQKNIVYNNFIGLQIATVPTGLIKNNIFHKNTQRSISIGNISNPEISHNSFSDAQYGIYLITCTPNIIYNEFYTDYGINLNGVRGNAPSTFNNLRCTIYGMRYMCANTGNENAINNFWGVTTSEEISAQIYDANDMNPPEPTAGNVIFSPFKTSPVPTAGVEH